MKSPSIDKSVLERILQHIDNISELLQTTSEDAFLNNLKDFNAICLEFIQIGEKVHQLSESFVDEHPEIPWHELYGLRNRIVHGYEKVRKAIIWTTITQDLPVIRESLLKLLQ